MVSGDVDADGSRQETATLSPAPAGPLEADPRGLAGRLLDAVRAALAGLPAEDRAVLRLRFLDGRGGPEIARATGMRQQEVYRRLYALLGRLARDLERRGFGGAEVREVTDSTAAVLVARGSLDRALAADVAQGAASRPSAP